MFSDMSLKGPIALKLQLTVPLSNPDKTAVKGEIDIKNSRMDLVPWNLAITDLNGELQFTEDTTTASNIQGKLFNQSLSFDLKTVQKNNVSIIQADYKTKVDLADIQNWLKVSFTKVAQGLLR